MNEISKRSEKYEDANWPAYEKVLNKNGITILKRRRVEDDDKDQIAENAFLGDSQQQEGEEVYNVEFKTGGGKYLFFVPKKQARSNEVKYFDFYALAGGESYYVRGRVYRYLATRVYTYLDFIREWQTVYGGTTLGRYVDLLSELGEPDREMAGEEKSIEQIAHDMTPKLYKLIVHESALEWTHNMGHAIWEIYIPQIGIVFNEAGGMFRTNGPRCGTYEEVEVPFQTTIDIEQAVIRQEKMEKLRKNLFNGFKSTRGEAQKDWAKEKIDAWIAGGRKGDLDLTTPPENA